MIMNIFKNLKSTKLTGYRYWQIVGLVLVLAMITIGLTAVVFVYRNIYDTINSANAIVILKSELGMDALDMPMYQKASTLINDKTTALVITPNPRIIFDYTLGATTTIKK